jgi:hypothetical protein
MHAMTSETNGFLQTLLSPGPAADRTDKMSLYAFLIGEWRFDAVVQLQSGDTYRGEGEIHAVWALQGRAVQDVWILSDVFYGTTLRVFDPALDAWHILWSDPLKQYYTRQLGRARGGDIVQDGQTQNGMPVRWSFIAPSKQSFRWLGEYSLNGGASWSVQADFQARRAG